jgi:hypothetical protein
VGALLVIGRAGKRHATSRLGLAELQVSAVAAVSVEEPQQWA